MIWVKVLTLTHAIVSIEISGHAEYAEAGRDLVCAAASSIGIGLCNAVDILTENADSRIEVEENRIKIEVMQPNESLQTILNTGVIQYQTLSEQFSEYIRVEKMEVRQ